MAYLLFIKEKHPKKPPKRAVKGQKMSRFEYIKQNSIAEIVSTMELFLVAEMGFEARQIRVMTRRTSRIVVDCRSIHSLRQLLASLCQPSLKQHSVVLT